MRSMIASNDDHFSITGRFVGGSPPFRSATTTTPTVGSMPSIARVTRAAAASEPGAVDERDVGGAAADEIEHLVGAPAALDAEPVALEEERGDAQEARVRRGQRDPQAVVGGLAAPRQLLVGPHDAQPLAHDQALALALPGGQLEHRPRAPVAVGPEGAEPLVDVHDGQVPVEEDGVHGKAHEPGLDGRRRPQQQPLAGLEARPAHEPAHAAEQRLGDDAALAEHRAVLALDRDAGHRVSRIDLNAG